MSGSFIQQPATGGGGGGGGGGGRPDGVPYSEAILAEPSLRHYYKMDEAAPGLDVAGAVLDSKGTKHGTAKFTVAGWAYDNHDNYKATLAPDGRSKAPMMDPANYGGYIELTADFGNDFMLGNDPFTYEAWFTVHSYSGFALPRLYSKEGGGILVPYWMNEDGRCGVQRGATALAFTDTYPIRLNYWHYIAGTYDGETLIAYADGQARESVADSAALVANSYVAAIAAGGSKGGNESIRGAMCHVAFYDTALTDEQIRNHWNDMHKSAALIV